MSGVHPSTSEIPENLLRFYVHFTAPMSRGDALRWVRLEDSTGDSIEHAFLALEDELWDPRPRASPSCSTPAASRAVCDHAPELGRALAQGREVTLVIDARWPDASGRPLGETDSAARSASARPTRPRPIRRTGGSSRRARAGESPLRIALGEPLDPHCSSGWCGSRTQRAGPLAGSIELGDDERSWSFTPDAPWSAGRHAVSIDRRLEDLAGNRVGRAFEVDLTRAERRPQRDSRAADARSVARSRRGAAPPALGRRAVTRRRQRQWAATPHESLARRVSVRAKRTISRSPALLRPACRDSNRNGISATRRFRSADQDLEQDLEAIGMEALELAAPAGARRRTRSSGR